MTPQNSSTKPTPTKVEAPKAPTPEALKVNFDTPPDLGIEDVHGAPAKTETPAKVVEAPVKPEVKTEVAPIEEAKEEIKEEPKVEQPKVAAEVIKPIKPSESTRDYTGYSDEEIKVLKNMSKQSFDYTTKLLKEKKELESLRGNQYLQHPDAYTLHPDFRKTQEDVYYANAEATYWQQQLIKIREGKKWQPIQGWDKNGQPVLGAEQEPTTVAEEQVRSVMNSAAQAGNLANAKLQQFQQQYAGQIQQADQVIKAEQQRRFGWHQDPKMLDSVINVEGLGDKSIRSIKQDFTNLFPSHYRSSVVTDIAGDLFVALQIYASEIRKLKGEKQIVETKKEEILRGEPSSSVKPSTTKGKTINGVTEFSIEGMPTL